MNEGKSNPPVTRNPTIVSRINVTANVIVAEDVDVTKAKEWIGGAKQIVLTRPCRDIIMGDDEIARIDEDKITVHVLKITYAQKQKPNERK